MSRSGRLPIHTPGRYLGQGLFGLTNHKNDSRWNLRLFILSHTQIKSIGFLPKWYAQECTYHQRNDDSERTEHEDGEIVECAGQAAVEEVC